MIKLIFTMGREAISFEIKEMTVKYRDRRFYKGIKVLPMDDGFERMVIMSRNSIPKEIVNLIRDCNTGKNLEEYQSAKNQEDLVKIVKKDAALKGCIFQKRLDIKNESEKVEVKQINMEEINSDKMNIKKESEDITTKQPLKEVETNIQKDIKNESEDITIKQNMVEEINSKRRDI